MNTEKMLEEFDVVVVGGGTAGLSGALTLARARRSVLVLDSGQPRNALADAAHGLLSRDGVSPRDLLRTGRIEVARYGGTLLQEGATSARRTDGGFVVGTQSGRTFRARRLLVTTGLVDELPQVPGLRARWGRDVLHCPYCHGWEVRDRTIGVLGTSAVSVHQALLFRQWSPRVALFLHSGPEPSEEQWERLAARGIEVVQGEVSGLDVTDDALSGVRLASGLRVPVDALVVAPRFVARGEILSGLGVDPVEHPMGVGAYVPSEPGGATKTPGVYVAGNVTDLMGGLPAAQASGVAAAAAINADLVNADADEAVARRRSAQVFSAADEALVCERVLGDRRHGLDSMLPPESRR
ncbi:NAD(P)/FAD-dependent oxidoreductase [Streptomyces lydicus]|uniref:NAD(P)/FAD-dependent oxidoreductase n=1 Tax=Streptomyces lydicus TaxID=47763 RepID=UPI0010115E0F|nr:NAD(P)/FAD-dependent oxidoreductase [Streptomyces lydicus]MCZ1006631.1 NAD(P)/FAD-dependent oxidoreductase [Streptomyces lydicus]